MRGICLFLVGVQGTGTNNCGTGGGPSWGSGDGSGWGSGDMTMEGSGGSGDMPGENLIVEMNEVNMTVIIQGNNYLDCSINIKTECQNAAYRFEQFNLEPMGSDCSMGESISVASSAYNSGPLCETPFTLYDWTRVDGSEFDLMLMGKGGLLDIQLVVACVEDLLDLPTCAMATGSEIMYLETAATNYTTTYGRDTIWVDLNETNCPTACWDRPGCFTFTYTESMGCNIYIGSVMEWGNSSDVVSSGVLSDTCSTSFASQFESVSNFFCRFTSNSNSAETLIDLFKSVFDFDVWTFNAADSLMLMITEETPTDNAITTGSSSDGGATFNIWIKFTVRSFHRLVGSESRRRRSVTDFSSGLTEALDGNQDIINALVADVTLPAEISLEETTAVEQTVNVLSSSGDASGVCDETGCDCDTGFEHDDDGNCVAVEPELPVVEEECDFSMYPDKASIDIASYVSHECRPSGYSMTADRCALELFGFQIEDIALNGPDQDYQGDLRTDGENSCKGYRSSGTNYKFDMVGINACGTERVANSTHVTVKNALRGMVGEANDIIDRRVETFISFSCVFQTEITVSLYDSNSLAQIITAYQGSESLSVDAVEAHFDFEIAVYTDLSYTSLVPADYMFNVPENVYIGVSTTAPIDRYHLSVDNCYFTADSDSTSDVAHQVMENGCPTAEVRNSFESSRTGHIAKIWYG